MTDPVWPGRTRRVRRLAVAALSVLLPALASTAVLAGVDSDGDGTDDVVDNCLLVANPDQRDSDNDDYGNACDADLNNDLTVTFGDLALFKSVFLESGDLAADFNGDNTVNFADLALLKASFQLAPGPSGVVSGGIAVEPVRRFPSLSFNKPIAMLQAPGDADRWFVVQQNGVVFTFPDDQQVSDADEFVDIDPRVESGGEAGLLGMAFHPDFAQNGHVFLSYTRQGPSGAIPYISYVSRFTSTDGGVTLDDTTEVPILTLDQPLANHNGGNVAFGPDGYLYIGFGDGGGAGDPNNEAQDTGTWLGALLRIDVNVDAADWAQGIRYYVPADNPFAGSAGCSPTTPCPEIYAYGFRNPWRWSFDLHSGQLWLADVGQYTREEVNIVENGGNYGWRCYEGDLPFNSGGCVSASQYRFPISDYGHGEGFSITGGFVYRGSLIPQLAGVYIYGDYGRGKVWGITQAGIRLPYLLADVSWGLPAFGQGHDGEVYMLNYNNGTIFRIEPQ